MDSNTEEFLAIAEYQIGRPERLTKLIRDRAGKLLSKFLADFLATLIQQQAKGKPPQGVGRPRTRTDARDMGLAHAVARYRQKEGWSHEDAVSQVADDTGHSESMIKRAYRKYSSQVHKFA